MMKKGLVCLVAVALIATPALAQRTWTLKATSGFTHGYAAAQMKDWGRYGIYDAVVDLQGNVFFTAGPCQSYDETAVPPPTVAAHGITIYKADGSVVNIDLSAAGQNKPGSVTALILNADGKVYGVQNWQEPQYAYDDGMNSRCLRINLDGTVTQITDFGNNGRWGTAVLPPKGFAADQGGNLYFTRHGASMKWNFLDRYNLTQGFMQNPPGDGTVNNGWSITQYTGNNLRFVEDGYLSVVSLAWKSGSGATGADQMSWTTNRVQVTNGLTSPGWGATNLTKTAYDPASNKLWVGTRGGAGNGDFACVVSRFNGADANTGLYTPGGLKAGTCFSSQDMWHANGVDPAGNSGTNPKNHGSYWVNDVKVNPADSYAWMTWGAETAYAPDARTPDYAQVGNIYTVPPNGCGPATDEGDPQDAVNTNASQTVAIAFKGANVYAVTLDLTNGTFRLFQSTVTAATAGNCCLPPGNTCVQVNGQSECPGIWLGSSDCTNCSPSKFCHNPLVDIDGDTDVDQVDFGLWQTCLTIGTGTGGPLGHPAISDLNIKCSCLDVASATANIPDGIIDLNDLAPFTNCASGPGIAADVACDDTYNP